MKYEQTFFPGNSGIKDIYGRVCMFHGCTLENEKTTNLPFLEENAHDYCRNLVERGYNLIYITLPWNAVEGGEIEQYNEEYLAKLRVCLKIIEEYPLQVLIVPDKKLASLPRWVLESCGIQMEKLIDEDLRRYAFLTFKTLFFAGNCFTQDFLVEGENIQDYFQSRFTTAMKHSARRIKDCRCVIGFDTGNSAESGFTGTSIDSEFDLITKASGFGSKNKFSKDPSAFGESVFLDGRECPWKTRGVWTVVNQKPVLLHKDFFIEADGHEINFTSDFLEPFQTCFIDELKSKHEHYLFIDKDSIPLSDEISPYPSRLCGTLISMQYSCDAMNFFEMEWESTACAADGSPCTEICIPNIWFTSGCRIEKFDGVGTAVYEKETGKILIRTLTAQKCFLRITSL